MISSIKCRLISLSCGHEIHPACKIPNSCECKCHRCRCTTKVHYFDEDNEICDCKQAKRRNA